MSHVLLIEPNRVLAETYRSALEQVGHSVRWVRGAQDAIFAADRQRPDLVVTELQLPQHSGIEFLYEFRSYGEWQHIPAIIFSAIPSPDASISDRTFSSLNISSFLYKPDTSIKKLIAQVTQALDTKSSYA